MLQKLNDPVIHEVLGRTLIQTIKIGLAAALFITAQKALHAQSANLRETITQDIPDLSTLQVFHSSK